RGTLLAFRDTLGQPLPEEAMPATQALQGRVLAGANALELHARALDGRELDLSVSAGPLRDAEGNAVGAVTVYHDVTRRCQLERERVAMIDLVAHDLRHPLSILQVASHLIRHELASTDESQRDKAAELLDYTDTSINQLDRMVEDLREAAR